MHKPRENTLTGSTKLVFAQPCWAGLPTERNIHTIHQLAAGITCDDGASRAIVLVSEQERRDESDFCGRDLFAEARCGVLPCFFGFCFVDVLGSNRHVCNDGHTVARDFDQPLAHGEKSNLTIFADNHLARHQLGHQPDMVRKKSQLALNARYRDHVNVFGINGGLRRNNFQFDGIRHVSMHQMLFDLLNWAFHVEVAFRYIVVLSFQNLLEAANRVSQGNLLPLMAGKHLGHAERLTQKTLNLASS